MSIQHFRDKISLSFFASSDLFCFRVSFCCIAAIRLRDSDCRLAASLACEDSARFWTEISSLTG